MKHLVLSLLLLPGVALAENRLVHLEVRGEGEEARIELEGSEPPSFTTSASGGRLVIDIAAATLRGVPAETAGKGPVRMVRTASFGTMARVAVELAEGAEADIGVRGNRLEISVARHLPLALLVPGAARETPAHAEQQAVAAQIETEERERAEEAERKTREEGAQLARIESERGAQEEAARVPRIESERQAEEEATRLARIDAERNVREEVARLAEREAQLEAERSMREVVRLARLEAEERGRMAADKGGLQEVTHVGFRPRSGGAQVVIRTADAPRFQIVERKGGVTVVFPEARIPLANNRRTIDASFFGTRVGTVRPGVDQRTGEVRIEVDVRGPPGVQVRTAGAEVVLDFPGAL